MKAPILIFVACGLALTANASASSPTPPEQKHLQPNAPRTVTISEADNGYLEIGKQKVDFHRTERGK